MGSWCSSKWDLSSSSPPLSPPPPPCILHGACCMRFSELGCHLSHNHHDCRCGSQCARHHVHHSGSQCAPHYSHNYSNLLMLAEGAPTTDLTQSLLAAGSSDEDNSCVRGGVTPQPPLTSTSSEPLHPRTAPPQHQHQLIVFRRFDLAAFVGYVCRCMGSLVGRLTQRNP